MKPHHRTTIETLLSGGASQPEIEDSTDVAKLRLDDSTVAVWGGGSRLFRRFDPWRGVFEGGVDLNRRVGGEVLGVQDGGRILIARSRLHHGTIRQLPQGEVVERQDLVLARLSPWQESHVGTIAGQRMIVRRDGRDMAGRQVLFAPRGQAAMLGSSIVLANPEHGRLAIVRDTKVVSTVRLKLSRPRVSEEELAEEITRVARSHDLTLASLGGDNTGPDAPAEWPSESLHPYFSRFLVTDCDEVWVGGGAVGHDSWLIFDANLVPRARLRPHHGVPVSATCHHVLAHDSTGYTIYRLH